MGDNAEDARRYALEGASQREINGEDKDNTPPDPTVIFATTKSCYDRW